MNLLKTIIERLNQRIEVANIFDKQFGLCELNANGNDKAWVHYIGNGQAEVVTNFDAKQGTLFWAKRGKVTVVKTDAFRVSGCKQLYITSFPLTAYAVVRKSHLPCDSEDAQDWLASRIYKITSGTDPVFKQSIGVINYEVVPSGYINEIKTLTANYEWACVTVDFDVQVITTTEDGCYDICQTGDIPLPDLPACTPCLTEVAVDGVTIIGNGTAGDPLSAIGAGGGAIVVQEEGVEVTPVATTLNFTGAGVTASLTSPGVVEVNVPGGGSGGVGTLQDVTDLGNSTTNDIDFIANAGLSFDNGTFFRKGTTDAGNGGAKGTAQICSLSYELKWEAGRLYYMEQDGFTIRDVTHNFSVVPQVTDDSSKGFVVGSRWSLDDGTVYLCSDDTIGAAVWGVIATSVSNLQDVTDVGNTTTNDLIVQGANDFVGQVSSQTISAYNSVTGAYAEMFVNTIGQLTLSDGTSAGILSVNNLSNANVQLEFPNKVTGNYTIATTADIVTQVNSDWNATTGVEEILNKPTLNNGTVTSVDLTMPTAFTVTGNPVTSSGTLAVAAAGVSTQYIRGDGQLANFPTSSGGGSTLSYYLNGSIAQGTLGGVAFDQMSSTPVIGAGTNFIINADGYIASFITNASVPNQLAIPAGNWNFEMYFNANNSGGTPRFYIELYKLSTGTLTFIASSVANPEFITNGNQVDLYTTAVAVPSTVLLAADRLAIRVYVIHSSKTITLHTEDNNLCQVITTFSTGLTALNGLTAQVQSFAVGTSGTDFAINSTTATHTFNLPTASATNRGALSSSDWSTFNGKQDALVSGTNIKTINSTSVLGSGNIATGTVTSVAALTIGTSGTDLTSTVATGTTTPVITLNVPTANAANRGALSAADWTTFNGKQAAITPAALTKVDDTNVTLTLGGSPTTALLQAASITAGWSGTLADARITSAATWNAKQAALVSGTNIKTINSVSLLGSGDITIASLGVYKSTTDGAASSGITNTFSQSVLIAANSVALGNVLEFKLRGRKTGTSGLYTIRLYINTNNNLTGAILLGTYSGGLTQALGQQLNRTAAIKNVTTNTEMLLATTSLATDFTNNSFATIAVDWTQALYLIGSVQNGSAGDSSLISLISMTII